MSDTSASAAVTTPPRRRRRLVRALWGLFALAVVLVLVGTITLRYAVRRAFPETSGTVTVAGLAGEVEVIRDSMGVPHIYANTPEDLFRAQGWVHAQDRFYQMDFWRHVSSGRLSEMYGSGQVDTDAFLRTMGWNGLAERQYAAETPDVKAALDAYAGGVNAYLATHSPADLSFEYTILELLNHGYDPDPWSPVESLAWGKVMSWDLGGNMGDEIARAMALGSLPPDRVAQLYPPYPGDRHPFIVPSDGGPGSAVDASMTIPPSALDGLARAGDSIAAIDALTGGAGEGIGSNSWAVSGSHTPTGMPMLMNDPHLSIQMPSIWYQVGLHCRKVTDDCPLDVVGFSFAGVPGVIIGHNADIAWAFTNVGPDVQDLYIEKVNPANPNQYELDGAWVDMSVATETIDVAGGDPVEVVIRSTAHGPIISDVYAPLEDFDDAGVDTPEPYAIAMRWTGLDDVPSIAGPILGINTARDFDDFRKAARLFGVPAQNLLYADTEGNIGYQMPGLIPIRSAGDGTLPVPGWTGGYAWTGFIPFDELPSAYNPDSGWIVTANNAVVDDTYPYLITEDWAYGYRARRIVDLVTSNLRIPLEGQAIIQFDGYDLNAEFLRPFVVDAVGGEQAALDGIEASAFDLLVEWDLQNVATSAGAAIWNATWRHVLALTFDDELGEDFRPEGGSRWFEVVRALASAPNDPFWDDVTTPGTETRDDVLRAAFSEAVDELEASLGGDTAAWAWGDLHTATFRNASLGDSGIGLIDDRFNRGPYPASGSESVPNAVGWNPTEGYEVDWLPSMRMLVDLGDFTRSYAIHTTGQSGHIDHPHYDDMIPLWLDGRTVPFLWDRADIEADAEGTLLLVP